VGVQNIRSLIHSVLDIATGNYNRWRDCILIIRKYSLEDNVLYDTLLLTFPDWVRMDCVVMSRIVGTISTDLAETVMERDATACDVWLALETQFLGNWETRALHLDVQFRNFIQGDLSITDYCRRFKTMAVSLAALGEPVTDRMLVLNIIRGLNDRYSNIVRHLHRGRPFSLLKDILFELNSRS